MKQNLIREEWWPVFMLLKPHPTDDKEDIIDVPKELVHEYQAACIAFNDVQDKLREIWISRNK